MTIFVTGAGGFLGSRLVERLVEAGHSVRTYGRSALPARLQLPAVEHIIGDIGNTEQLTAAIAGCSQVYHLAGLVSYRASDHDLLVETNVIGTRKVMEACLKNQCKRVIHFSSIAGMGIPPKGEIGTEQLVYNLQGLGLYYCDSKHQGELEALKAAGAGLPVLVISPGITFGEGDTHPHHHTIFKALASGRALGYPRGGVMFSDIEDVVATAINALQMGRPGESYVVGSANLTFKDAAKLVSSLVGSRPPVFAIPGPVSEAAGILCESIFPLFGKKPALTRQVAWLSQRDIFFSSDKAIAELGHRQTPFDETIKRTAPYYLGTAGKQGVTKHAAHQVHYANYWNSGRSKARQTENMRSLKVTARTGLATFLSSVSLVACSWSGAARAQNVFAVGKDAKTSQVTNLPISPPGQLSFLKREDIIGMRRKLIERTPLLISGRYEASHEVFGSVESAKPWWGMAGACAYGKGSRSIDGLSEESRFVLNPLMMVGLNPGVQGIWNPNLITKQDEMNTQFPFYWLPDSVVIDPRRAVETVTYDVSRWHAQAHATRKLKTPIRASQFSLVAYNARDFGYNWIYFDPRTSINVSNDHPGDEPVRLKQMIHCGNTCGYPGGCNNMSPFTKEIDRMRFSALPARAAVLLYKERPDSGRQKPDLTVYIDIK